MLAAALQPLPIKRCREALHIQLAREEPPEHLLVALVVLVAQLHSMHKPQLAVAVALLQQRQHPWVVLVVLELIRAVLAVLVLQQPHLESRLLVAVVVARLGLTETVAMVGLDFLIQPVLILLAAVVVVTVEVPQVVMHLLVLAGLVVTTLVELAVAQAIPLERSVAVVEVVLVTLLLVY